MDAFYNRTAMLLGVETVKMLTQKHVLIAGLGGVGSFAAEAIARAGVGRISLLDFDTVSASNRNRQLCALVSTEGEQKTDVVERRILDINPQAQVMKMDFFYEESVRERVFSCAYDFVIDAIDTVSAKTDLIATAVERQIPILSALGTGNKLDPTRFEFSDIYKTAVCPLARVMRRELKKRGISRHRVLYSREEPLKPLALEQAHDGRRSVPGSVSWVPSCAGLMLAGEAIRQMLQI